MTTKTELIFSFNPSDFFESPFSWSGNLGHVTVESGKVIYVLTAPLDPLPDAMCREAEREVSNILKLRRTIIHRQFTLTDPNVVHHQADGRQNRVLRAGVGEVVLTGFSADVEIKDASGRVIHSSRANRIRENADFITALMPKMTNQTLAKMVDSYGSAVMDPADELVHLFEIAEAAERAFGGEAATRSGLGLTRDEWRALSGLANDKHIRQGRHRGQHTQALRDATQTELETARAVARKIIEAFAARVQ